MSLGKHLILSTAFAFTFSLPASPAAAQAPDKSDEKRVPQQAAPAGNSEDTRIPPGSRIYIAPIEGFEIYLVAGLQKKEVPLIVVTDRGKADFEMSGVSASEKAGWAKMLFRGSDSSREQASVKIVNLKTGTVVWAYAVNKGNSARGKQSAAESCAKHLKAKMEGRE
jgi:hypothetical protein